MPERFKVIVCRGPNCGDRRGSRALMDELKAVIGEHDVPEIRLQWQSCFGRCTQGPNILVQEAQQTEQPARSFVIATPVSSGRRACMYNHVQLSDVGDIVCDHLRDGKPVRRLIQKPIRTQRSVPSGAVGTDGENAE